jgi:GNAT superfamily N-acetyltransferase
MFGLRTAAVGDIPAIWEVRARAIRGACRAHYSDDDVERWAAVGIPADFAEVVAQTEFLVMADATTIAAFGFLDVSKSEIGAMFVQPDFQGAGFGRRILSTLESIARQAQLPALSLVASLNAERFYAAAGFKSQGRAKWQHPAGFELECVNMTKPLPREI